MKSPIAHATFLTVAVAAFAALGARVAAQGIGGGVAAIQERQVLAQFDKDHDGRLNAAERQAAYESLRFSSSSRGGNRNWGPADPGVPLKPADVKNYPATVPLYDAGTLRTVFLDFEDSDWEAKMAAFYRTDIDVPAKATIDGKTYKEIVGVHFRGNSSYSSVPAGYKRSLNIDFEYVDPNQKLYGRRTLLLLNANEDPTFMRGVLALLIARDYFMAPQADLMRVVINGEDWGIYENVEQYSEDMVKAWYPAAKGDGKDARWKVPGTANNGRGALVYMGGSIAAYKQAYEIKSKDDPAQWNALAALIDTLHSTPPDKLEAALKGKLDVDGVLKFLAWDNVLVSGDGFWSKGGDYSIYRDPKGAFDLLPHDINEFFLATAGRGGSPYLDPLVNEGDFSGKEAAARLLAVPALKARYLGYIREISAKWLVWDKLGPIVQQYAALIRDDVYKDTKKLFFNDEFDAGVADVRSLYGTRISLRNFVETRREYLDSYRGN